MAFNDSLDFSPSTAKLAKESRTFHVILSGYLRSSKTFQLYQTLASQEGIEARLLPYELPRDSDTDVAANLAKLVGELRNNQNFRSILVSDPYKWSFARLVDEISPAARDCGAINVVFKHGERIIGDNFDGAAFAQGAQHLGISFVGKRMAFLGCGGVTSAVAFQVAPVLQKIALVDVDAEKSAILETALKNKYHKLWVEIIYDTDERDFTQYEYIYNGTGLGKKEEVSPLKSGDSLPDSGIAFDANYTPASTLFLKQLSAVGFRAVNGLSHMMMCTSLHLSAVLQSPVTFDMVENAYRTISLNAPPITSDTSQ